MAARRCASTPSPSSRRACSPASGADTGFQIDPIGDQVRGVPFIVTIRAVGLSASTFQDRVSVRANKGATEALTTGSFAAGVREELITLLTPSSGTYLLVEDAQGHKGLSNSFHVLPH
jgi:hypothetical protein